MSESKFTIANALKIMLENNWYMGLRNRDSSWSNVFFALENENDPDCKKYLEFFRAGHDEKSAGMPKDQYDLIAYLVSDDVDNSLFGACAMYARAADIIRQERRSEAENYTVKRFARILTEIGDDKLIYDIAKRDFGEEPGFDEIIVRNPNARPEDFIKYVEKHKDVAIEDFLGNAEKRFDSILNQELKEGNPDYNTITHEKNGISSMIEHVKDLDKRQKLQNAFNENYTEERLTGLSLKGLSIEQSMLATVVEKESELVELKKQIELMQRKIDYLESRNQELNEEKVKQEEQHQQKQQQWSDKVEQMQSATKWLEEKITTMKQEVENTNILGLNKLKDSFRNK